MGKCSCGALSIIGAAEAGSPIECCSKRDSGSSRTKGFPGIQRLSPSVARVTVRDQLAVAIRQIGYPALCKTATSGYDGKGQWRISQESDIRIVERALSESARPGMRWILESLISFERELSILVVRGT